MIRNRVKRLVREFARGSAQADSSSKAWVPSGLDVVVIAKRGAGLAPASHLWSDLEGHRASLVALDSGEKT